MSIILDVKFCSSLTHGLSNQCTSAVSRALIRSSHSMSGKNDRTIKQNATTLLN